MTSKEWWTVFAVYDDSEEPYIAHVQAEDKADARSKALRKADGVILIAGIAPGRIRDAGVEGLDDVVPIRGRVHLIEVTHVRIARRKIPLPSRCPKCRHDFKRAGALAETMLDTRQWLAHLSPTGKEVIGEKLAGKHHRETTFEYAELRCASCAHPVWEGLHAE